MELHELRRLYASMTKLSLLRQEYERFVNAGVIIPDPDAVYVSSVTTPEMIIGQKTILSPHVCLLGAIAIGERCTIGPGITICNAQIGNDVFIGRPQLFDVIIGDGAKIGRFAEITRSHIGAHSAAQHLCYIGDTYMGEHVNAGAGLVTGNFNGEEKNVTVFQDGAFPGINTSFIAPITIGKEACVGAGAVVTKDVAPHAIVVGNPARPLEGKSWHRTPQGWKKQTHQPL